MKNYKKYIIGGMAAALLFPIGGCDNNFDDYNTNPNESTTVTAGMLATELILKTTLVATRGNVSSQDIPKNFMKDDMLS